MVERLAMTARYLSSGTPREIGISDERIKVTGCTAVNYDTAILNWMRLQPCFLPADIRHITDTFDFKRHLKVHFLNLYFNT